MAVRRLAAAVRGDRRRAGRRRARRRRVAGGVGAGLGGGFGQRRRAARAAARHALGVGALAGTGAVAAQARRLVVAFGNAVLSRWPVAGVAHADLPGAVVRRTRRAAGAARGARHPGGAVAVLHHPAQRLPGAVGAAVRAGAADGVVRRVATRRTPACRRWSPGDLNAVPESDEVRLLEGFLTEPAVPDLLLVDAWRYAAPADRGITWSRANPHAAKTGEPDARIDYVLVGTPRGAGAALVTGRRGWRGIGRGTGCGPRTMRRWWRTCSSASRRSSGRGSPDVSALEVGGVAELEDRGAARLADGDQGRGPGEAPRRLELKGGDLAELPVPDDHETGAVGGGEVRAVRGPVHRVDGGGVAGAPDDHGVAGCRAPTAGGCGRRRCWGRAATAPPPARGRPTRSSRRSAPVPASHRASRNAGSSRSMM